MDEKINKKIAKLLKEAFACYGAIAEAKAKCVLFKRMIKKFRKGTSESDLNAEAMQQSISQIRKDFTKYSRRIYDIHEELESYGVFSNLGKLARIERG